MDRSFDADCDVFVHVRETFKGFQCSGSFGLVRVLLFSSLKFCFAYVFVMVLFWFAFTDSLFITWVIWIAGASALTQTTGGGMNCSTNTIFNYCGQLNALIAFGYINWYVLPRVLHTSKKFWRLWFFYRCRILLTFIFAMCILLAVRSWKRGDGLLGSLIEIPIEEK